ncbi:disulfide bond formation protein B [Limoniibacter endophyticus]|uniref:Disulfide bond formation protein B n=1 Tax=Limoniibacter endophyticus TaxID=1565040 RepID=A0A8J3GIC4_9HYPH|nr:disulfide bond formation protein B [Limoniibacter endophyticus]GHC76216.1 disulfide bond formation protein B [Limoniibacter endophyticus]
MFLFSPTGKLQTQIASAIAIILTLTIGGALLFQHVGGYVPCMLCYQQRTPYYVGIPLLVLTAISAGLRLPPVFTRGLFILGGLLFVYSAGFGVYHAGVEWGWWAGPADCGIGSAPIIPQGGNVLEMLDKYVAPACDHAALRIAGISLAGWNAVISAALAIAAFYAGFKRSEA